MATKLYLKSPLSSWNSAYGYLSTTPSVLTFAATPTTFLSVTNTTSGGSNISMTATAGGTAVKWISPPLAAAVTISGTITYNLWAKESNALANATVQGVVKLYTGGAESTTVSTSSFVTEVTTTIGAKNWTDAAPSSTAFAIGDRIVFIPQITNAGTMGASQTVTMDRAGKTAAADGDTWIQFNEALSFQSEAEFIQAVDVFSTVSGTTVAGTLPGASAVGNALVVYGAVGVQTETLTVADGGADTPTTLQGPDNETAFNNNSGRTYLWDFPNITAATKTVTVTKSASNTNARLVFVCEYGGVAASPVDVSAAIATGTGTAAASNNVVTTAANDVVIGVNDNNVASGLTAGANQLLRIIGGGGQQDLTERSVTATGTHTATGTLGSSGNWLVYGVALKWATQPASNGSSGLYYRTLLGVGTR